MFRKNAKPKNSYPDTSFDSSKYSFAKENGVWVCSKYNRAGCLEQWMADPMYPGDWFTLEGEPIKRADCHVLREKLAGYMLKARREGKST